MIRPWGWLHEKGKDAARHVAARRRRMAGATPSAALLDLGFVHG